MWLCENCRTVVMTGTVCPACGRPFDPAVAVIDRKIRHLGFLSNLSRRWTQRGVVIGFLTAIILAPMLAALLVPHFLSSTDDTLASTDSFAQFLALFLALPILLPLLFGCIAFLLAVVVHPLYIALFYGTERFEGEYDLMKQRFEQEGDLTKQ